MDNGWLKTTLGELCDRGQAMVQTGPFGSQLHSYDYQLVGVPVVPTEAIGRRRIRGDSIPRVSEAVVNRLARHKLKVGDILFARRGAQATGLSALVESRHEGWLCGTGAILMRLETADVDPTFLSYLLSSDMAVSWLRAHAVGAVMPNLNEGILRRLPLYLPPLKQQQTIARVLTTLDDKIELNRSMNDTLDAMARAVFKSFFVDASQAVLPEGWETNSLADLAELVTKGTTPTQRDVAAAPVSDPQVNYLRVNAIAADGSILDDKLTKIPESVHSKVLKRSVLRLGDVLYTIAGTIGRMTIVEKELLPANCNQAVAIIRPKAGVPSGFLLLSMQQPTFQDELHSNIVHAVQANLSLGMISKAKITCPGTETLSRVFQPIDDILKKISANRSESRTLATLRDALLPKLLSGKTRISSRHLEGLQ